MLSNKRGVALLQVLIVTAILAGMATMVLRVTLTRQLTSRQTRHTVTSQMAIEACMAEVNNIWGIKTPHAYKRDLAACQMCDSGTDCEGKKHTCNVQLGPSTAVTVVAEFTTNAPDSNGRCPLTYTIVNGINL